MNIEAKDVFSAMSNNIRLRCLCLMQLEGELCVCELTYALGLSQPMISRHLALLRDMHFVTDRRAGQWIYYRINPQLTPWVTEVIATTMQANKQVSPYCDDLGRLQIMPNRPGESAMNCCA